MSQQAVDLVCDVINYARSTGKVSFGGEYVFLLTDDYNAALNKLSAVANAIGGEVEPNFCRTEIRVVANGRATCFWEFRWSEKTGKVSSVSYYAPVTASF